MANTTTKAELYSNIPQELKNLSQWVLWKFEKKNDGNLSKIPYQVNKYKASPTNPKTWSSFKNVTNVLKNSKGFFDGIGLVFTENDPYVGIDLDNYIKDGEMLDEAKLILNSIDSYAEYSQSGKGIHIIIKGKSPYDKGRRTKNKKVGPNGLIQDVEVYDKERYFIFTGNIIDNYTRIESRQEELELFCNKYIKEKNNQSSKTKHTENILNLDDKEIIEKLENAKNSSKFNELYRGDTSSCSNDHSAADLALCSMISFYTDDFHQIDRIFSSSGLYRAKWDRTDYKNSTINKALEINSKYDPEYNRPSSSPQSRINNEISGATDEQGQDSDNKFFLVPRNIANTNSGLKVDISLLAIYMKQKYDIKSYQGQFRIFKNNYYSYIEDIKKVINSEIPQRYRVPKNIRDCEELLAMDGELTLRDEELANQKYVSFRNGILNIENMQFKPYSDDAKKLIFISQVGYDYDPNAPQCDYADNFFKSATNGNEEDINFLYQILGVLISNYRDFKNIFYFTGKRNTGKSVYMHIAELLLTNPDGTKDFSSIGLRTLTDETSKEFVKIIGKKANICGETPDIRISNDTLLKQLSGGDVISAQVKFKESVEFINRAILIFSGNSIPSFFVGDKSAIGDRMLIYKFKNIIPENEQIKRLEQKISIPYVIKKSIEQLKIFVENNQEFIVPQEIAENREQMLIESDTIYKFYKERIIITDDPKDRISNTDLYNAYIDFLVDEGHLRINHYDNSPDLSKFKITQYIFTSEMKKYHGEDNHKRNLSYKNYKSDVFINMTVERKMIKLETEENQKVIKGMFN